MQATKVEETTIALTNEDIKNAIRNMVNASYRNIHFTTKDIKIIGNNDNVTAQVTISEESLIDIDTSHLLAKEDPGYKVDKHHPDYKGNLGA